MMTETTTSAIATWLHGATLEATAEGLLEAIRAKFPTATHNLAS
jgi:hypothetical protein